MKSNIFIRLSKSLVYITYFIVPLIFSHFFYFFLLNIKISNYGYEITKVITFCILTGIAFLFFLIGFFANKEKIFLPKKFLIYISIYFLIIILSNIFSVDIMTSIIGSSHKMQGSLLFICLGFFFTIQYLTFDKKDIQRSFYLILAGFGFILLYCLLEYIGINPVLKLYAGPKPDGIIGTLGNANYLAGYILMLTPLFLWFIKNKYIKTLLLIAAFSMIVLSGSIFGILVFITYLIYLAFINYKKIFLYSSAAIFTIILLARIAISIFGFDILINFNKQDLLYSFYTRLYLWKMFVDIYFDSIPQMIFGRGLDTLHLIFAQYRPAQLSPNIVADRFHNIFLDILYWFGLFGIYFFVLIFNFLKKAFASKYGHALILFLLYFCFNIFSISHLIIVVFIVISYLIGEKEILK